MSNGYYLSQRDKQQALIGSDVFRNDNGNGKFMGKNYPFVLAKGKQLVPACKRSRKILFR